MVMLASLPKLLPYQQKSYRLINSKFPPISLFDDVADAEEFEALFALQALTNPRLHNEVGNLELIPRSEIPFGIKGCSYATGPFTHVNPNGSRFSDGTFGVLYLADSMNTAIAEVKHHQQAYWQQVPDLNYERFVFRGLTCHFDERDIYDATTLPLTDAIYSPDDYSSARALGSTAHNEQSTGLRYHSVRNPGATCWALLTPRPVNAIVQSAHYEMIWNQGITGVNKLTTL